MLGLITQPPVDLRDSTVPLRVQHVRCSAKVLNICQIFSIMDMEPLRTFFPNLSHRAPRVVLYLLCAALCLISDPLVGKIFFAVYVALLLGSCFFCRAGRSLLFGAMLPLSGIMGAGVGLSCFFIYLAMVSRVGKRAAPLPFAQFLTLAFASCLGAAAAAGGPGWGSSAWFSAVVMALRWSSVAFCVRDLPSEEYSSILKGILLSMLLVLVLLIGQGVGLFPHAMIGGSAFWESLRRESATFSDPNAAGVFLVVAAPLLVGLLRQRRGPMAKAISWVFAGLLLAGGSFTGSRSFFFGIAIWLLVELYRLRPWFALLPVLCGCIVLIALPVVSPGVITHLGLPSGLERALNTVTSSSVASGPRNDSLFSRAAFLRIDYAVWRDAPFLGVGLERFREYVPPYAELLGIGTGTWSDNPNSFYAQILVEFGVLGGLVFLLCLVGLRRRGDEDSFSAPARVSALILIVLFVFGPHLAFDEVAILCGVVMTRVVRMDDDSGTGSALTWVLAVPLAVAVFVRGYQMPHGEYAWERDSQGVFRWSAAQGRLWLECSRDGVAEIEVRFAAPLAQSIYLQGANERRVVRGLPGQAARVRLPCSTGNSVACPDTDRLEMSFVVTPSWIPAQSSGGGDNRELGVQFRYHNLSSNIRSLGGVCVIAQ